jgi:hypothetical protein
VRPNPPKIAPLQKIEKKRAAFTAPEIFFMVFLALLEI